MGPEETMPKFCSVENERLTEHNYGNVFFEQLCGGFPRLVIGPSRNHVGLQLELARMMEGSPWFLLYVLLISRDGSHEPGRFQSEEFKSHADLCGFMESYREFFEGDGRHHVWVGTVHDSALLVYDQHNVIFAYGPLETFKSKLRSIGFVESEFWFPVPHTHAYHARYDKDEARLLSAHAWRVFPLQPGDKWE